MADARREADEALILLSKEVGTLSGVQTQILETINKQWERQQAEDEDHRKIKESITQLQSRMEDVPQKIHHVHHDFVDNQIKLAKERADLCRRARIVMVERALPYALLALVAAGLYVIGAKQAGMGLIEWMQK